nr:hypothetical protein [Tanacetum cinerariifolium]
PSVSGFFAIPTPMMLDSCTATTCTQPWGRMDYARAFIDLRADRALKDTLDMHGPKCDMADLRNQGLTSNEGFKTVQRKASRA